MGTLAYVLAPKAGSFLELEKILILATSMENVRNIPGRKQYPSYTSGLFAELHLLRSSVLASLCYYVSCVHLCYCCCLIYRKPVYLLYLNICVFEQGMAYLLPAYC